MAPGNPKSTASIAGHPIHPMLIPFPIAFFVATFVCDIVFASTGNAGWVTASTWLLGAGLIMAVLAAIAGLTDNSRRRPHPQPARCLASRRR